MKMGPASLYKFGLLAFFVGVTIAFIALALFIFSHAKEVKAGVIIMIEPFPIVFGSDAKAIKTLIILTIVLILISSLRVY